MPEPGTEQDDELQAGTPRRDEMSIHGIRGLVLLNGGGAVALLAFLQAAWENIPELVPTIVSAMIPLVVGAACAVAVHFLRIQTSLHWFKHGKWLKLLQNGFAVFSFVLFLAGMTIVIVGSYLHLPAEGLGPASQIEDLDATRSLTPAK